MSLQSNMPNKKPELLSPAGSLEKLKFALAFGADAVYAGVPSLSLRTRENAFTLTELAEGIAYAHALQKKIYITANIMAHNDKLSEFFEVLSQVVPLNPDGFIMSDPGLMDLARQRFPDLTIHLSTQANTTNWAQAAFWKRAGVTRIILARELTCSEIANIIQKNPGMEFECFVHGSMCVSYSGRCLISDYLADRASNEGLCAQACRWKHQVFLAPEHALLQEEKRPHDFFPVEQDRFGTYFSNSKDLCTLDILPEIIMTGVSSIKIEGRNKNLLYLATTTRAYRRALDALFDGTFVDCLPGLRTELQTINQRGYTEGFFHGRRSDTINYRDDKQSTHDYAGYVLKTHSNGTVQVRAKQKIELGDTIEWVTPKGIFREKIEEIRNPLGEQVTMASGGHLWDPVIRSRHNPGEFWLLRKQKAL